MLRSDQMRWMRIITCFLIVGFMGLTARLIYVQAFQHEKYKGISEGRVNRTEYYSPRRGEIRDVSGNPLAVTRDVKTVILDPGLLAQVDPLTRYEYLNLLASLLNLDRAYLNEKSWFFKSRSGGQWTLLSDTNGMPVVTPTGIPVYAPLDTNGVARSDIRGVAVEENGVQIRNLAGEPVFALLNKKLGVMTNRYVRIAQNVPVEDWDVVQKALRQFPIDKERKGYTRRTASSYRALRTIAVYAERDFKREYPNGNFMSHLLGFTRSDDEKLQGRSGSISVMKGMEGVERAFDMQLTGTPGWREKTVRSDGSEILSNRGHSFEAGEGLSVVLTLDSVIQSIVEEELQAVIDKYQPQAASCVVAEVKTGRILAYGILPDYNPNEPSLYPPETWRNRIIMDLIEPGSTFKIVPFCAALNEGNFGVHSPIDCSTWDPSWGKRPKESSGGNFGTLTMEGILVKSSNVGFGKMGWILGSTVLNQYIRDFGYRSRTGIMLPGEVTMTNDAMRPKQDKLSISRVPIGQGIAVTQLQSTMAMGAVANGGVLMRPQILDHLEDGEGNYVYEQEPQPIRRVIKESVARSAVEGLRQVAVKTKTQTGTAYRADMKYHTVGGKTGTAQKAGPGGVGYEHGKYFASFVGFFPTSDPVIVMSVMVDEPDTRVGYYGGVVSAPVFKNIAERIATYLAIPPDKELESKGTVK